MFGKDNDKKGIETGLSQGLPSVYPNVQVDNFGNGLFTLHADHEGKKLTYSNYIPGEFANTLDACYSRIGVDVRVSILENLVDREGKMTIGSS